MTQSTIITIRPEPHGSQMCALAQKQGLAVQAFPLSEVRPLPWEGPDPASFDAILAGSANAFRHAGEGLARYRGKPVFAVGPATGRAAFEAGFTVGMAGTGGLQQLLPLIPERPIRLLRLAGARHVPIDPPEGISVTVREVYEVVHLPLPDEMAALLKAGGALVLLHSAGAAEHFAAECDRLGIDRADVRLAALGPRIAAAAGDGWGQVQSAPKPANGALLALAQKMCQ
ncbi:uroporphyrinogen-III synthase [Alteraurantiacibacter palmitatis]|uniref:Uroporphyrinogen-III synthase n=1 Tax=Alteraurantiacibacter palmitatis TaxID=2054628 RepID=A0ABV7E9R2_9SPHN